MAFSEICGACENTQVEGTASRFGVTAPEVRVEVRGAASVFDVGLDDGKAEGGHPTDATAAGTGDVLGELKEGKTVYRPSTQFLLFHLSLKAINNEKEQTKERVPNPQRTLRWCLVNKVGQNMKTVHLFSFYF